MEYRALFGNNWKNIENKRKLSCVVMDTSSSSQCSGSSEGGSNCELCSSKDFESFISESDISGGHEVVSLLDRLKSPRSADTAQLSKIKTNGPPHGK